MFCRKLLLSYISNQNYIYLEEQSMGLAVFKNVYLGFTGKWTHISGEEFTSKEEGKRQHHPLLNHILCSLTSTEWVKKKTVWKNIWIWSLPMTVGSLSQSISNNAMIFVPLVLWSSAEKKQRKCVGGKKGTDFTRISLEVENGKVRHQKNCKLWRMVQFSQESNII